MNIYISKNNLNRKSFVNGESLIETLIRLQSISNFNDTEWLELLQISWKNYQQFKMGCFNLSNHSLIQLSEYFNISSESIINNNIDFKKLAILIEPSSPGIADYYMVAPFSRRRTTITSINYLEENYGWRLKQDVLKIFKIKESALLDPFEPVSMRLISEICKYLHTRQFNEIDFFKMGAYTVKGNQNSILSRTLARAESVQELYHDLINVMMPLFETNSDYSYTQINQFEGLLTMKSIKEVASQLGVKHLGNEHICQLKRGFCASAPSYMGLPYANVTHTACEHLGDQKCVFKIDLKPCLGSLNIQ